VYLRASRVPAKACTLVKARAADCKSALGLSIELFSPIEFEKKVGLA
jgi:hypothetical protein